MELCPNCGGEKTQHFFNAKNSPILQNILLESEAEARAVAKVDVEFKYCPNCHFIFNPKFEEHSIDYTENYDNNRFLSPQFVRYLDDLTTKVIEVCKLNSQSKVLEIGCGNADFLAQIQHKTLSQFVRGYDPAYNGQNQMSEFVSKSYFLPKEGENFDLIVLRHALEGMLNSDRVLSGIVSAMHADTKLYLEIVNLDYIIKNKDLSLIFHECAKYYSLRSLQHLLHKYDLEIQQAYSLFNNNYLGVFVGKRPEIGELNLVQKKLRETVLNHQKVVIWGIGGRAISILANMGWDKKVVRYGVDLDENKQGNYIPVTGQLVISPQEAIKFKPELVIVSNANYLDEIIRQFSYKTKFLTLDAVVRQNSITYFENF